MSLPALCPSAPGQPSAVYRPRDPRRSPLYGLVEDYHEEYARVYERRFEREYGPWRPHVADVLTRFLSCGDLRQGFARVRCEDCQHEYLLAFSCKTYAFCPSYVTLGLCACRAGAAAVRPTG